MHRITYPPPPSSDQYTADDLTRWADDLARIRAVARRKRLLGCPDPTLEAGCAVLERRLAAMREVGGA